MGDRVEQVLQEHGRPLPQSTITRQLKETGAPAVLTSVRMPKLPQSQKPAPSGFSRTERLAIFRAAGKLSVRDRAIIYLAMWTGAMASSLAAVKLSAVDIKSRSGSIKYDIVKGGAGKAYSIPLNVEARDALADWIKQRPPVKHDLLFTSEEYPFEPVTRWTIHDVWHRRLAEYLPKELVEELRGPHQARHGLARLLLDQGVPLPDVAAILNHSSVATTADIYCRPSEKDLRQALEKAAGEEGEE
ncbi:MAG: tyrosine-type recombinase/integrase [Armatimonadetes bacterium]|nr:tyrosine-type recombinase/integrase [Armatimonadota bacterium]